ncbi:MAG TPA: S53 family peptidase [Mycobacteriales bacterium]|nr:S53 family peptidase [Mycobacteriales bacterium]
MKPSTASRLLAAVAAAALVVTGAPAVAAGSSPHPVKDLLGRIDAIPSWARGVLPARLAPTAAAIQIAVAVKGRNQAELRRFVAAVSDPASPSYRHFLTNAEYNRRFAPAAADVAAARSWLQHSGFVIDTTTAGIGLIAAHAPAATVGRVFSTTFGLFRVGDQLLRAPLSAPTLPSVLRPIVSTVIGLAQTPAVSHVSPAPAYLNARPCSRYYGQKVARNLPKVNGKHAPYAVCGYTARQLRSAYGVDKVRSAGRGVTVAVVGAHASSTIVSDVNTWSRRMGLPTLRPGQLSQVTLPLISDPPVEVDPVFAGQQWQGEESLDIEAVHAMAPRAKIVYYSALSGFGLSLPVFVGLEPLLLALAQAVGDGKADVVSNSWGGPSDLPTPGDTLILDAITNQAAAKGITIAFSSGDSGDMLASTGKRSADFPATSPGVVAVGGTTLQVGKNGKRISESYWGNEGVPLRVGAWDFAKRSYSGGGGGGVSTSYAEPAWQRGVVPKRFATFGGVRPGRVEPDLSLVGDSTTGMLVGLTQHFPDGTDRYGEYRIGGTSLGCPLFSGMLALAVSTAGHRLGLVTPALYAKSRTAAGRSRLFYDPVAVPKTNGVSRLVNVRADYASDGDATSKVVYSLRLMSVLGTLHARRGYDDSTGLGVPKAPALVAALARTPATSG